MENILFTLKDVVSFGNYLLSEERSKMIANKENMEKVHNEDLVNYLMKSGKIKAEDE